MTPATVEDAYTMLIEAVAIDDPVIYCEHKYLYYHLKADKLPTEGVPTGKARVAREGRDLTIVSLQRHGARSARSRGTNWPAKVMKSKLSIFARLNRSIPTRCSLQSRAQAACLCVGESFPWGGVTAEVIARVAAEGFHLLDAAPQRSTPRDTPIPYHPNLWSDHRPNAKEIARKARALLRE